MSALPPSLPVPLHELPDGTLRVVGTRVPLDTIVGEFLDGLSAETIAENFSTVSLADVYACIAYYLRNREEVDAYLARRQDEAAELRRQVEAAFPPDAYRAKVQARRAARGA